MRHGSLFSGIGGFDLAAFGKRVLNYYWPKAISYDDITKTDFTIHRGRIDILTGGFPCQPYSAAGKRLGKEDDRHLWPEMLRAIREIQPTWIVGENVRGLTNWNGGMVFDEVQADLEAEGYEVTPFLLPACAVNAPHRRDRIWFVAHSNTKQRERTKRRVFAKPYDGGERFDLLRTSADPSSSRRNRNKELTERCQANGNGISFNVIDSFHGRGIVTNTERERLEGTNGRQSQPRNASRLRIEDWSEWPTESPVCHADDGISGKLDGITFPKWRTESIKGGGNAIVPQVVYQIFKAIEQYDTRN